MTDAAPPQDSDTKWAAWLVAHRNGTAVLIDTAPPLEGRELRKRQAIYRKAHGMAAA